MNLAARSIARTMTAIAAAVAAFLVIGLPAGYFALAYQHTVGTLETEAQINARYTSQIVFANPRMWVYEEVRLAEMLARRPADQTRETRRIVTPDGRVVAQSADPLAPPLVSRRFAIADAGRVVAHVEIARSLRPILLRTGGVLAGALLVAVLVFVVVRTLPLRAVRQAYGSLAESEARYRSLYDTMSEGVALYRTDPRDGAGWALIDANPACARILGARGATMGRDELESTLSRALTPRRREIDATVQGGPPAEFEVELESARTVKVAVFTPGPNRFAAILEDVTEQRQVEQRLNQAQKMEAIGRLAGGIAHDFNNLLTVILSFAASLSEELEGEQREEARAIASSAQRAAVLTRQLLTFARRRVPQRESLDLGRLFQELDPVLRQIVGERVVIRIDVRPGTAAVHFDRTELEQILINLALNARDAMPAGGALTIAAWNEVLLSARGRATPGQYVAVYVSDTGTGMDEVTRSRAFEPFFTTKPKGQGTGLGLSTVYATITQEGGDVEIASAPARGSTFTLFLPRATAGAAGPGDARPATIPAGNGQRILVVDDEPAVRLAVCRFLGSAGYAVVEAPDGAAALEAFRGDPSIALILTDVVMPGMTGVELGRGAAAIRAVPVRYMSGYSEETVVGDEVLSLGALLTKPFDRDTVLRCVGNALASDA